MRRWMHILLIGILTLGLSIDSASACRHWRKICRPRCHRPVHAASACHAHVRCTPPAEVKCCGAVVEHSTAIPSAPMTETVISERIIEKPGVAEKKPAEEKSTDTVVEKAVEPTAPTVAPPLPKPKEVVPLELPPTNETPAPMPAPVPAAEEKPAPVELPPATKPTTPENDLFSVEPKPAIEKPATVIETPAPKPAPAKEPPAEEDLFNVEKPATPPAPKRPVEPEPKPAPAPAKEKKEENLFDEFGSEEADEKPLVPVGTDDAPKEAAPTEEEPEAPADAAEPAEERKPADPVPAEDDPFAAVHPTSEEPMRTWVDNSGTHRTFAKLVEVRPNGVRLLKDSGTHTTVPLDRLSDHDRVYVNSAKTRMATAAPPAPEATDTAGL